MRIALLGATRRGHLFLEKLASLAPDAELLVFSFREEPWEPPFLDDLRALTLARGGQFFEAKQLGSPRWTPVWESAPVDLMLVVSWRYMLPPTVFRRPRLGTFVFHDSLLPEYRGFAPTVWALLNGEDHTGVTLFEIAESVDSGDVVDQQRVPIGPDDAIGVVLERVTEAYLQLLERNLGALLSGQAARRSQDEARATYTCKRLPEDNAIDWSAPTERIFNLIRAVSAPYPGAYTTLQGERLRVWAARRLVPERRYVGRVPGRVAEVRQGEGAVVLTGDGALLLTQVQRDGGPVVGAAEILNSPAQTLGR
jgi:methionyl-tRNA formyltransferase